MNKVSVTLTWQYSTPLVLTVSSAWIWLSWTCTQAKKMRYAVYTMMTQPKWWLSQSCHQIHVPLVDSRLCITGGGVASTGMPLRARVCPSDDLEDSNNAVMLCSYVWSQGAPRIRSLIEPDSSQGEEELIKLMFDDWLNCINALWPTKSWRRFQALIAGAYVPHHAVSWSHDPYTSDTAAVVCIAFFLLFLFVALPAFSTLLSFFCFLLKKEYAPGASERKRKEMGTCAAAIQCQ